jgi:predicted transcriptional regulator
MFPMSPSLTDRSDVIEWILEEAQTEMGLAERRIMNQFSLSRIDADLYFSSLIGNKLLRYDSNTESYRTTDKGADFLQTIRRMYELDELVEKETGIDSSRNDWH